MKHMGWGPVDETGSLEDLERAYLAYMSPFGDGVAHGNSGARENLIDMDYWYPTENLKKLYLQGLEMGGDIRTLVYANITVQSAEAAYNKAQLNQIKQMNKLDFLENEVYRYEQFWAEVQHRSGLSTQKYYNVLEDNFYSNRIAKGYYYRFDYSAFGGAGAEYFKPPKVYTNTKGQITNGTHTIDSIGMEKHMNGTSGKSQFLYDVDAEKAVLDASAYADEYDLWKPSSGNLADFADKAKVPVINGNVGVTGNGEVTNYINIYRTKTGFVHGCPGNPGK